jgi:hypothetical protein
MFDPRGTLKALLVGGLLVVGCAPKQESSLQPPPAEPNPQPEITADVRNRVAELVRWSDEYAAGALRLPGRNEQEDRQQVAGQFELLSQILPALNGPEMTGDFRQALRIVESTRAQLAGGSMELSAEPTIDTGLRAAQRALAIVARRQFSDQAEVGQALDAMGQRLQELDTTAGPLHRLVAGQAFRSSADAVGQMVNALDQRLNDKGGATAPPAKPAAPAQPEQPKTEQPKPAEPTPTPAPTPTPTPTPTPVPTPTPTPEPAKPEQPKPAEPAKPELNK